MAPVNFVGATEAYATLRISLNGILTEASATVRMSLNGSLALCSLSDSDRKWVFRGLAVSEAGMLMTTATLPSIYDCRVGDTVQRKRGGPHMTIERLDSGMEGGLYRHLTGMEGDPYRHLGMEGGPYRHLTVERCGGPYRHPTVKNCDSGVHCVWHDGEYTSTWLPCELKRDVFSADALNVTPPSYTCHDVKLEPGDPVKFSHGGPKMWIVEIDSLGVHCSWSGGRDVFPAAVLCYVGE